MMKLSHLQPQFCHCSRQPRTAVGFVSSGVTVASMSNITHTSHHSAHLAMPLNRQIKEAGEEPKCPFKLRRGLSSPRLSSSRAQGPVMFIRQGADSSSTVSPEARARTQTCSALRRLKKLHWRGSYTWRHLTPLTWPHCNENVHILGHRFPLRSHGC